MEIIVEIKKKIMMTSAHKFIMCPIDVIDEKKCLLHDEHNIFKNCINKVWPYSRVCRNLSGASGTTLLSFYYSIKRNSFSFENLSYPSHMPFSKHSMDVNNLI